MRRLGLFVVALVVAGCYNAPALAPAPAGRVEVRVERPVRPVRPVQPIIVVPAPPPKIPAPPHIDIRAPGVHIDIRK